MKNKFVAETSITIEATAAEVWKAITTPSLVKKWLMGTHVTTDWKVGSAISYEGEYDGRKYHDKGIIRKMEPEKVFQSTFWSSASGKADEPENYNLVTYTLNGAFEKTIVTITQDNVASGEEQEHVAGSWKAVLRRLKEVVEKQYALAYH